MAKSVNEAYAIHLYEEVVRDGRLTPSKAVKIAVDCGLGQFGKPSFIRLFRCIECGYLRRPRGEKKRDFMRVEFIKWLVARMDRDDRMLSA